MNKHKRFIKEAYEGKHGSICQDWKDTILKHYPEFKEEGFKVGDWVYRTGHDMGGCHYKGRVFRVTEIVFGECFGEEDSGHLFQSLRKATKEEILSHLSKEADKRGYDFGVSCKSLLSGDIVTLTNNGTSYIPETDELHVKNCVVYKKGQWAEIIKIITKEEAEKKLGMKII